MTKPIYTGEFVAFSPFDRLALAELIRRVARPGVRMAEIGSWLGNGSTQVFLEELRHYAGSSLLCVDTWLGNRNVKRHQDIVAQYDVFETFQRNVEAAQSPVQVSAFVSSSCDAAAVIADPAFDLVFIDADHSYAAVRGDIAAWSSKVRPGGILCGHDCETRLYEALKGRVEENRDADTISGEGTPFPCIHPGCILAVHEAFQGSAGLYGEMPLTLADGTRGCSTIWLLRVVSGAIKCHTPARTNEDETVLRLEALPAGHGDCLWIEYGDPASPRRILIDGGARGTYKRALQSRLVRSGGELELLVVTHVDSDHITGILELIGDAGTGITPKDVWFNGFRHLPSEDTETLGPVQGEKLTGFLVNQRVPWNIAFDKKAVVVPDQGELPRRELAGGLTLTLLSPTVQALANLRPVWEKEVRKAGLDPNMAEVQEVAAEEGFELLEAGPADVEALATSPFVEDASEPNGSSIAMLLDYEGQRILLSADAHPRVLASAIKRHNGEQRLKLTACKIPHHGSKFNVSRQLLDRLECDTYVFSTNGAHFKHPDREGVARVIKWGGSSPKLIFNYDTSFTGIWKPNFLKERFHYEAAFPEVESSPGIVLNFP